jgi:hypothetical protein
MRGENSIRQYLHLAREMEADSENEGRSRLDNLSVACWAVGLLIVARLTTRNGLRSWQEAWMSSVTMRHIYLPSAVVATTTAIPSESLPAIVQADRA